MNPTSEFSLLTRTPIIATRMLIKAGRYSFGPIKGAQPAGTTWANNYPHTAWFEMSQYYVTAFKTGSYPAITVRTTTPYPSL